MQKLKRQSKLWMLAGVVLGVVRSMTQQGPGYILETLGCSFTRALPRSMILKPRHIYRLF